ncbi:DUF859 family phage minor structural protein [Streptococcus parauberis]|uniref:DUF859 family phage minor structural protein n=1 Tax=Streptococcus parauberis TaxID=1348 RepID=UPI00288E6731|nr:DUF859 family phage minor structural protein [Streptococcus parauberis]MDT2748889.1 DUF859 family phage minor structural protein [Streptococcus parauberis]
MTNFYSNSDRGYSLLMIVENVGTPNIANNTSDVRARLYLRNTTTTFAGYTISGSMTIDGTAYSYSASPSMLSNNSSILLLDKTKSGIGHNSDGKKTITVSASIRGSGGYSPGTLTIGSNQFTLPAIQRASTVTCTDELDIGSTMTIGVTAQSTSFTHTLRYIWNGKTGTIASGTTSTSLTWTVPMDFCNDIPNGTRFNGTIYCDTYSGSTLIGTKQDTFYGNVPDRVKPTLSSITLTDTNNKASTLVGASKFVQIMSNPSVTFNGASGAYGSTIKFYNAEIVGKNQTTSKNGGTLGIMTWNGTATVKATVTDSRGHVSAPFTTTIDVLPYSGVAVDFTAVRGGANANQIVVNVTASISPLLVNSVQKNRMTLQFKTAPYGTQTFTIDTSSASTTYTDKYQLLNQNFVLSGTFASDKSFDIYATLTDSFGITPAIKSQPLLANFVALAIADGGTVATSGVGVGKEWEHGSVDAAGDIYTLGKIFIKNKELLDVFYPIGTIYESAKPDNPSTFMGGTWSRFGNGKVLVGVDENDADFNTVNKTGGEKAHTLTIPEMPSHTHTFPGASPNNYVRVEASSTTGLSTSTKTTDATGGGQAHNNLQPFVTVYRWQRTA